MGVEDEARDTLSLSPRGPLGISRLLCENCLTLSVAAICERPTAENSEPGNGSGCVTDQKGCEETGASWNKIILKNCPKCIVITKELQCML